MATTMGKIPNEDDAASARRKTLSGRISKKLDELSEYLPKELQLDVSNSKNELPFDSTRTVYANLSLRINNQKTRSLDKILIIPFFISSQAKNQQITIYDFVNKLSYLKTSDSDNPPLIITNKKIPLSIIDKLWSEGKLIKKDNFNFFSISEFEKFEISDLFGPSFNIFTNPPLSPPLTNQTGSVAVPAADRFVRLDDNAPELTEAKTVMEDLVREVSTSNSLTLARDERRAIVLEISTLLAMLCERTIRLGQLQFAIAHDGVLNYLKTNFKDHAIAGLVGKLVELILVYLAKIF